MASTINAVVMIEVFYNIGVIGLMDALERGFDKQKRCQFEWVCLLRIKGTINCELEKQTVSRTDLTN